MMFKTGLINVLAFLMLIAKLPTGTGSTPVSVEALSKKWKLEKYAYLIFSEAPKAVEKNDYLLLKSNLFFESVSEGKYEKGSWRLDTKSKRIYLSQKGAEDELVFIIDEFRDDELVLIVDDPADEDSQYLKIHFKS
ncbi:MAG: hypothetical protein AAF223_02215 [Bacteroidota bacterium]